MGMYFDGYSEARESVKSMDLTALLEQIDTLYGRNNLHYGDEIEDIRQEAFRQLKDEFTDRDSEAYIAAKEIERAFKAAKGYR